MDERMRFVIRLKDGESMASLCREFGISRKTGTPVVVVDPKYYRPTEVELLIGDATKARQKLGWSPATKFEDLVIMMAKADFEKVSKRGF